MTDKSELIRENTHTISLLVTNKPGVLLRICLVFSRRGFNIESLVVSPAYDGRYSRMTITARGDRSILSQIIKQCAKLIDVVEASEYDASESIEKEFALVKVKMSPKHRVELLQLVQHFDAHCVDISEDTLVFEIVGDSAKLDNCITIFEPFGIIEMVRSGKMAIAKGALES
jgi:acetolactate synthase-1/3 small subunit